MVIFLTIMSTSAGYWYWADVNSVTITSDMFVSEYNDDGLSAESYVDADDPSNINILATTSASWGDAYSRFLYDTGKNNLGGSDTTINAKYRAIIYWYLSGIFDDNDASTTFMRYTYTLYYMSGSTQKTVATKTVTINDKDHGYDNTLVKHYVTTGSSVPSDVVLYVKIKFELSASGTSSEWNLNSDFNDGANKVVLSKVVYQNYIYKDSNII